MDLTEIYNNNMKLYLVERTDCVNYDEFDSFVVRASSEDEAFSMCKRQEEELTRCEVKITQLTNRGEATVILGSFNAG